MSLQLLVHMNDNYLYFFTYNNMGWFICFCVDHFIRNANLGKSRGSNVDIFWDTEVKGLRASEHGLVAILRNFICLCPLPRPMFYFLLLSSAAFHVASGGGRQRHHHCFINMNRLMLPGTYANHTAPDSPIGEFPRARKFQK